MSRIAARVWCVLLPAAIGLVAVTWLSTAAIAQRTGDRPVSSPPKVADADSHEGQVERTRNRKDQGDVKAEAKIRDALGNPTTMEFIETPLQDAVDYLKDHHGIEIQLDTKALEEVGVGTDTPLTHTIKGISLASALRLLLGATDMTYVVTDGVLLITTPEAVSRMVELRVYDVRDLIQAGGGEEDLPSLLRLLLAPEAAVGGRRAARMGGGGMGGMGGGGAPPEIVHGAQIVSFGNLLIVRASIAEQETLADLLAEIRSKIKAAK